MNKLEKIPSSITELLTEAAKLIEILSSLPKGNLTRESNEAARASLRMYLQRLSDIKNALDVEIQHLEPPRNFAIDATHALVDAKIQEDGVKLIKEKLHSVTEWAEKALSEVDDQTAKEMEIDS